MQDREIEWAYKEASRAENMIKYKDDIMSRPKNEWHKSYQEKKDLRKESKKDLKNTGNKFDESLTQMSKSEKLRVQKMKRKEEERLEKLNATTTFGTDQEARTVKAKKGGNSNFKQNSKDDEPKDR